MVELRSYSRNSGLTSWEAQTYTPVSLQRRKHGALVGRVLIRVQEADRDGADSRAFEPRGEALQLGRGRAASDGSVVIDALMDAEAQIARDQGPAGRGREIVQLGAVLAADLEKILESGGGDESGPRAFALE